MLYIGYIHVILHVIMQFITQTKYRLSYRYICKLYIGY